MRLRVGDHLVVKRGGYSHHGIYVGRGKVIHFVSSIKIKLKGKAQVCESKLKVFCDGAIHRIVSYLRCSKPATVLRRARSLLGQANYCIATNNCEHLARLCKSDRKTSRQVEWFRRGAVSVGSIMWQALKSFCPPWPRVGLAVGSGLVAGLLCVKIENRTS